ncbi:MFS transporter [Paenibacillus thermotolerans]|uniref:MFS transporter n=1 Tax=Paenibacillus thermotolerans TaxID=3027807 RepID=UPI002367C36F|nr:MULTISPECIES: MFS transporter [unclassified Paenibacillus]
MDRKQVRAWIMYDWANSAYMTTMMAAVLPIFFVSVPGAAVGEDMALSYWAYTQSAAMLILVLISPILGAVADVSRSKVKLLGLFMGAGVLSTLLYALVGEGDLTLAVILTLVGVVGVSGSLTFYDALLGDIVPSDKRDRVSAQGYAYGYLGGGLLLAINLLMIQKPALFGLSNTTDGTRLAFVSVGLWWLLFSIPLLRTVKEKGAEKAASTGKAVREAFARLQDTFRNVRHYPELLKYLAAFWFFSDGIGTIIKMATVYGAAIGIGTSDLILALLITQFVGLPFSLLFGKLAEKFGAKSSLYGALAVYVVITVLGYFMTTAWQFYALACLVGVVQGGSQSLARSIYIRLIPAGRSAEYFGFMSIWSKFAGIVGPAVFGFVNQLTGEGRFGILALIVFFVAGIALLKTVNIPKGEREAAGAAIPGGPGSGTVSL